jgi:hypothetical protein
VYKCTRLDDVFYMNNESREKYSGRRGDKLFCRCMDEREKRIVGANALCDVFVYKYIMNIKINMHTHMFTWSYCVLRVWRPFY